MENKTGSGATGFFSKFKDFVAVGAVCLIIGLVFGAIAALNFRHQRDHAQQQFRISSMESKAALAALLAYKGDFEGARQDAGDFFDQVRQESVSNTDQISKNQLDLFNSILNSRDDAISRLATHDSKGAEMLSGFYIDLMNAHGERDADRK